MNIKLNGSVSVPPKEARLPDNKGFIAEEGKYYRICTEEERKFLDDIYIDIAKKQYTKGE